MHSYVESECCSVLEWYFYVDHVNYNFPHYSNINYCFTVKSFRTNTIILIYTRIYWR